MTVHQHQDYASVSPLLDANRHRDHSNTLRPSRSLWYPQHDVQDKATAVHYVLLRAPWAVLCYYAEDLRLKLPLQVWGGEGRGRGWGSPPRSTFNGSLHTGLSCQNYHSLDVFPPGNLEFPSDPLSPGTPKHPLGEQRITPCTAGSGI